MVLREEEKEDVLRSYEDVTQDLANERIHSAELAQELQEAQSAAASQLIQLNRFTDDLAIAETAIRTSEAELRMSTAERDAAESSLVQLQNRLDQVNDRCCIRLGRG